tara:strand:- start:2315 stop:2707 length:393 start_codon:yes stop_codon:yes gene_type:complete
MSELENYGKAFEDERPRVFKLVTGEEIVTTVIRTDDQYFIIEVPLEIRYNSIKQSLFLTKWMFGADYSKVMTLSGSSIISVSTPEDIVSENYAEYRKQLIEGLLEETEDANKEEYSQMDIESDEDTPTFH